MHLMVPLPVTVRLVDVVAVQGAVPDKVHTPVPTAIVRTTLLLDDMFVAALEIVTFLLLASNVPDVIVNELAIEMASVSVTDPLGVLIVNGCVNAAAPALVMVCDPRPENVMLPDPVNEHPDPLIQFP